MVFFLVRVRREIGIGISTTVHFTFTFSQDKATFIIPQTSSTARLLGCIAENSSVFINVLTVDLRLDGRFPLILYTMDKSVVESPLKVLLSSPLPKTTVPQGSKVVCCSFFFKFRF